MSKQVSKSKETKKEAQAKTNRRKSPAKPAPKKSAAPSIVDGQKAEDARDQLTNKNANRLAMFEVVRGPAMHVADGFVKNVETNNPRMPVPMNERRRVKVDKDEEYLPAQYVKMENSEYIFAQAPNKALLRLFWKVIQQDRVKIVVCLCTDDQISATDDTKCYPYFPTEVNQPMEVEQLKGKFTIVCTAKEGLSMGGTKYEMDLIDSETVIDPNSDDPNAATQSKAMQFTLFHMNSWTGTRPETGNPLEQAQNVALFLREVNKAEVVVLRKSMENFIPPVVLQSFDAVGRAAIAWVILMLFKDVEKRECFDVTDLMKKLMKMRPGTLSTYYHFAFTLAVALHIGKEVKWCENECNNALNDLTTKFSERKLNDVGNLLPPQ